MFSFWVRSLASVNDFRNHTFPLRPRILEIFENIYIRVYHHTYVGRPFNFLVVSSTHLHDGCTEYIYTRSGFPAL